MPDDAMNMLLESVLESQRTLTMKLDSAIERMATREDIAQLRDDLRETVGVREYNVTIQALTGRVSSLEAQVRSLMGDKMPKWFWTVGATILGAVISALTAAVIRMMLLQGVHHVTGL